MKTKKVLKISIIIAVSLVALVLIGLIIYISNIIKPIQNMDIRLSSINVNHTEILDNNDNVINVDSSNTKNYISIDDINQETKDAFISIEDKNFYTHNGLNYKRIVRAMYNNLLSKDFVEGASTITQQLVKNKFLTNEKTFDRKIKEAYLSIKLEQTETKDKILETYLNTIYYGNGAYGIGNASLRFFNKNPKDLTLSESCVLAGCIKSPSNYSPINNMENSLKRRNLILREMLEDEMITQEKYDNAINEDIVLTENTEVIKNNFDLYSNFVLDEASKILNTNINNVINGGYKIYTYQDMKLQLMLDKLINDDSYYHKNSYGNISDSLAMIIDNNTLGVSCISGKSDYNLVNFKRQPGSLIKPIMVYAPALEEGVVSPITQILDEEIDYNGYTPNNVGNKFYGYISVKDAVSKSLNIPAVKVCEKVGLEKCKKYATKSGVKFSKYDNGYALALGGFTEGTTLKEITDSYIPFIKYGDFCKSSFIKKIEDVNGMSIYSNKLSLTNIYNTDTVYLMTDILKYSIKDGTSKKLNNLDFDVAGKTGTVAVKGSNYNTDAYSLAYTNNHIMSVWFGNYTMQKEYNLEGSNNGGTYATQLISDAFSEIYKEDKPNDFIIPNTVQECIIDHKSLTEDHIIVLGDNIPERYQIKELFSKRYLPNNHSTKFNTIDPFEIKIITHKNSCEISFDTYDYIEYKLYKKFDNKTYCLDTIKNSLESYKYIDTDIQYDKKYTYYVVAENIYSNEKYTTNNNQIYLTKDYDDLITNNLTSSDNLSWLFG